MNKKYYIGCHVTKNIDDNYFGSGKILQSAMNKYGVDNFKKEVLFIYETPEEMYEKEKELVNEEFVKSEDNYNINIGGQGGWYHLNYGKNKHKNLRYDREHQKKISPLSKENITPEMHTKRLQWAREGGIKLKELKKGIFDPNFKNPRHVKGTYNLTEEHKKKIGETNSKHQKGKGNSQYGTMWITDGKKNKKINKDQQIPIGWYRGRKIK